MTSPSTLSPDAVGLIDAAAMLLPGWPKECDRHHKMAERRITIW